MNEFKSICKIVKSITVLFLFISFYPLKAQTIPVVIDSSGFIFIDVTINDSVKTKFLLDTGGGISVLSNKLFQKLNSSLKNAGYFTGFRNDGERLDGELFTLPSISIGNFRVANVNVGVYPPLDDYGMEGVISMKEFENQPITIDFKKSIVTFEDGESIKKIEKSAEVIPITLSSQMVVSLDIFVPLLLNDSIKIMAEFDTGSGYDLLLVNPYFMLKMGIDSSTLSKNTFKISSGKTLTDYFSTLNTLRYGSSPKLVINDKKVMFRQDLIYEGLIGSGMFKDKILTIDIPDKKMLVRN